jgi:hypothetical protein
LARKKETFIFGVENVETFLVRCRIYFIFIFLPCVQFWMTGHLRIKEISISGICNVNSFQQWVSTCKIWYEICEICKVIKNSLNIWNPSTLAYRSESQKYKVVNLELHVNIPQSGEASSAGSSHSSVSSPVSSIQGLYGIATYCTCSVEHMMSPQNAMNSIFFWNMF